MQAYYEIEAFVHGNHQLNLQLPDTIPVGHVKVAVIYNLIESSADKKSLMAEFLNDLPDNSSSGLTKNEIQHYIEQERHGWDS